MERTAVETMQPGQVRELLEAAFGALGRGRHQQALARCERVLAAHPDQPDALHLAGIARMGLGRTDEAAELLARAAAARPEDPEILGNLGTVYLTLDRGEDAAAALGKAVALDPGNAHLRANLGAAERAAGRLTDSAASLERALTLKPDHVPALYNLGNTLCSLGRTDEAAARYLAVLKRAPGHAEAALALAYIREEQGDAAAAIALMERSLAGRPDHREIRYQLGLLQLKSGRFEDGWRNYLARPDVADEGELCRERLPDALEGRRIFVHRNQGLGDELFFLRFLPALQRRGARVTYEADPRIVPMLARAGIADAVVGEGAAEAARGGDLRLSAGDLPWLTGAQDASPLPPTIRLEALEARAAALRERLAGFGPPPYIGVTWRAGRRPRRMLFKECPADQIAATLRPLDARVVILQRLPEAGEVADFAAALGRDVLDLSAMNANLEDMLALVGLLDDQLCVSNTNVHLAAARGRTCRVLLPNPPEFRWMAAGDESPWFPGMRLYRQGTDRDWRPAFAALARDVGAALAAEH